VCLGGRFGRALRRGPDLLALYCVEWQIDG
jgi:hypothetical protein